PVTGVGRAVEVAPVVAVTLQVAIASLPLISIYALLAAAYSLVYGLIGRIHLAFGELAVGGAIAAYLGTVVVGMDSAPWFAMAAACALGCWAAVAYGGVTAQAVVAPLARR